MGILPYHSMRWEGGRKAPVTSCVGKELLQVLHEGGSLMRGIVRSDPQNSWKSLFF